MLEDRNIQLGNGLKSVEERGVFCVVTRKAKHGRFVPRQEFNFKAQLCESREELSRNFSLATSVSVSAYGADLGFGYTQTKSHDVGNFDSYYMMELEYINGRLTLDTDAEHSDILDPAIHAEVETLDSLEKWEEFYRTKGNQVVSSVTYGRKLIIIVSLSHKIRSDKLRRILEAKAGAEELTGARGELTVRSALSELAQEDISSVQIHSIGDSNPNYMHEIEKLVQVKAKVNSFLNPSHRKVSIKSPTTESIPKIKKTPPDELSSDAPIVKGKSIEQSDSGSSDSELPVPTLEKYKGTVIEGVIIGWETCSYVDLLKKGVKNIKKVESAYDEMLRRTSQASRYLEAIAISHGRIGMLIQNIDFYCQGHEGAFTLDVETENNADQLREHLNQYRTTLNALACDIVTEISGQSKMGRSRRIHLVAAKEYVKLHEECTIFFTSDFEDVDLNGLEDLWPLVEKFDSILNARGGADLKLKERLNGLQQAIQESKTPIKVVKKALNGLIIDINQQIKQWFPTFVFIAKAYDIYRWLMERIESSREGDKEYACYFRKEIALLFGALENWVHAGKSLGDSSQQIFQKESLSIARQKSKWDTFLKEEGQVKQSLKETEDTQVGVGDVQQWLSECAKMLKPYMELYEHCQWSLGLKSMFLLNSEEEIVSVCEQLENILRRLFALNGNSKIEEVQKKLSAITSEFSRDMHLCHGRVSDAFTQCRLNEADQRLIMRICQEYVDELNQADSPKQWWENCWQRIYEIAEHLDDMVNNRMPKSRDSDEPIQFRAIDFKRQSFFVGALDAKRNRYFNRRSFTSPFKSVLVPSNTRFLRFTLEGENLPDCPVRFTISSKHKRYFGDHKSRHRTLFEDIRPDDLVYPLQPNIRDVDDFLDPRSTYKRTVRGEQLMNSPNESMLYKSIRALVTFSDEPGPCSEVILRLYAQMGNALTLISLSKKPPIGRADYGVRMGMVGMGHGRAEGADIRSTRHFPSPTQITELQEPPFMQSFRRETRKGRYTGKQSLRPAMGFFEERSSMRILQVNDDSEQKGTDDQFSMESPYPPSPSKRTFNAQGRLDFARLSDDNLRKSALDLTENTTLTNQ